MRDCRVYIVDKKAVDSKYLPLFLLLNEPREERFARWYLYGFGLLLIAKDYVIFGMDVSLNVALNPLILTAMAGGIILESFLSKQRGRREKVTEESIGAIVFD